ncbi:MAG: tRNA preQ1(34) S-adenosylmethionine ribosyltransferase-isomerase QueA [Spirochaetaceae bacterium]|jgi:S-adenosylmethionine:tRNA ribosyltransferase-isomerase|nr:tRNA preQ1(34) S-adenosylmethionine ribosyltransferase-isomerase QueA [Spirochaetaceae bacterium]
MDRTDFSFNLSPDLIAQFPSRVRGDDRLMTLSRATGSVAHHRMDELPGLIPKGALMVFNDSRVRKSRLFAVKESSGAQTEFLFIAPIAHCPAPYSSVWQVMVKNARRHRPGMAYCFADGKRAVLVHNPAFAGTEFRELAFPNSPPDEDWFERIGHVPLPPYIARSDEEVDSERYQTVYARQPGSAAAPTAGLHFTQDMLRCLGDAGIDAVRVTLHVGLGTFLPVRTERVEDHVMHREVYRISEAAAERINAARGEGRPVLAVGTTSVRTLESAWHTGEGVKAGEGTTEIFIYPGYRFRVVDALFTNFHTPESTLLMLVSAVAGDGGTGRERILEAYRIAVEGRYRFFSYGDAMFIA